MATIARVQATAVPLSVWTNRVPFCPSRLVADVEPAGLVVGAVRRAGHLAVLAAVAAAGHPGFEVVLAVRRAAEVAGAGVDDVVRQAQALEDLLLDRRGSPGGSPRSAPGVQKANISTLVNWWTR